MIIVLLLYYKSSWLFLTMENTGIKLTIYGIYTNTFKLNFVNDHFYLQR